MAQGDLKMITTTYTNKNKRWGWHETTYLLKHGTNGYYQEIAKRLEQMISKGTKEVFIDDSVQYVALTETEKSVLRREAMLYREYHTRLKHVKKDAAKLKKQNEFLKIS